MNLDSFENHLYNTHFYDVGRNLLYEEGGVKYTRSEEQAEELGFICVTYNMTFFDQKKNDVITVQSGIFVRNHVDAIKLCNFWNARATNYKYWI